MPSFPLRTGKPKPLLIKLKIRISAALTTLFAPSVAAEKARLAEEFLTSFPRSWFFAPGLEIVSKAFIDLGD